MEVSMFWVLLLVLGTPLMAIDLPNLLVTASATSDMVFTDQGSSVKAASRNRMVNFLNPNTKMNANSGSGHVSLDDYPSTDPVPSSRASIKAGPIEHGFPLNPYIPTKPSPPPPPPPGRPKHVGFDP